MSITSLFFILFLAATLVLYYLIPRKYQWVVLLTASVLFYLSNGINGAVYILITSLTIYIATRWMNRITLHQKTLFKENKGLSKEEKNTIKRKNKQQRKAIMLTVLLINLGILCVFKYSPFVLDQVNNIAVMFGGNGFEHTLHLIAPLGISFYTFQSIGYLVDVYWEYYAPEKNYFKVLLFISFFPQITQGPISDYETLTGELFVEHRFDYKNYSWGFQRMTWGFVKKLLLADILSVYVNAVFANYSQYAGITVLIGAFMYSIQIYADFSGYMDIMCGYCEMLGIHLTENFDHPYFSKSIAEYWRRWHITLGDWFKKYIYYPIGMSGWSRRIAQKCKDNCSKHFANSLPASIALLFTWLSTGLWHGASWAYITWGLVNGMFIIFELWMEPVYTYCKAKLKINETGLAWKTFQILRTFFLVTCIKVLPEVGTLQEGFSLLTRAFTNYTLPRSFSELMPFVNSEVDLMITIVLSLALLAASLIQTKNKVRCYFNKLPMLIRVIVLAGMYIMIGIWADLSVVKGFMYANF